MYGRRHLGIASALLVAACGPAEADLAPSAVSLLDDAGRRVALAAPATRVVSLVPSLTGVVVALDPGVLVARTRFDREPELAHLPSLGEPLQPNLEAVARLRPDLVIVWQDVGPRPVAERLDALGIPVYRARIETLADLRRHLRHLGALVDRPEEAEQLWIRLDEELSEVARAVAGRDPVDVYYSVWHDPPQTAGAGTFVDQIIERAGGRNVFADLQDRWPRVSLEAIVRRDPETLVVAGHDGVPDEPLWLRGPGWRELSAVRDGRYMVVDADIFHRPGPRLAEAARHLARFLHGGDILGGPPPAPGAP